MNDEKWDRMPIKETLISSVIGSLFSVFISASNLGYMGAFSGYLSIVLGTAPAWLWIGPVTASFISKKGTFSIIVTCTVMFFSAITYEPLKMLMDSSASKSFDAALFFDILYWLIPCMFVGVLGGLIFKDNLFGNVSIPLYIMLCLISLVYTFYDLQGSYNQVAVISLISIVLISASLSWMTVKNIPEYGSIFRTD